MNMLLDSFEPCVMLDRTTESDGYGGVKTVWKDGAEFEAGINLDDSIQARVGAVQGLTSLYTVITGINVILQYHDVFRRVSDNKIFRVTKDNTDKKTPPGASMSLRKVNAEEWELPDG